MVIRKEISIGIKKPNAEKFQKWKDIENQVCAIFSKHGVTMYNVSYDEESFRKIVEISYTYSEQAMASYTAAVFEAQQLAISVGIFNTRPIARDIKNPIREAICLLRRYA